LNTRHAVQNKPPPSAKTISSTDDSQTLDVRWFRATPPASPAGSPAGSPRRSPRNSPRALRSRLDEHRAWLVSTYLHRDLPTAFPRLRPTYESALARVHVHGSQSLPGIVQELSRREPRYFEFVRDMARRTPPPVESELDRTIATGCVSVAAASPGRTDDRGRSRPSNKQQQRW